MRMLSKEQAARYRTESISCAKCLPTLQILAERGVDTDDRGKRAGPAKPRAKGKVSLSQGDGGDGDDGDLVLTKGGRHERGEAGDSASEQEESQVGRTGGASSARRSSPRRRASGAPPAASTPASLAKKTRTSLRVPHVCTCLRVNRSMRGGLGRHIDQCRLGQIPQGALVLQFPGCLPHDVRGGRGCNLSCIPSCSGSPPAGSATLLPRPELAHRSHAIIR